MAAYSWPSVVSSTFSERSSAMDVIFRNLPFLLKGTFPEGPLGTGAHSLHVCFDRFCELLCWSSIRNGDIDPVPPVALADTWTLDWDTGRTSTGVPILDVFSRSATLAG